MPPLASTDRQVIIALCEQNNAKRHDRDFQQNLVFEPYFIKYQDHCSLKFECETQRYLYSRAVADPTAPRVPAVVDYFTERYTAYLVMDFIEGATSAGNAHEMVANALQWLRSVPAPLGATIGSVGGGPARHRIFKDHEAPLLFPDNESLQIYLNKALKAIPRRHRPQEIDFTNEKLVFIQSDMHAGNFLIDKDNKICLLDFGAIELLPESFASYAMHPGGTDFPSKVAQHLNWPRSPNEFSMARARQILWMSANPALGLCNTGKFKSSSGAELIPEHGLNRSGRNRSKRDCVREDNGEAVSVGQVVAKIVAYVTMAGRWYDYEP